MAKPAKSQWDFGELFPAEALRKVLTVSELTGQVKRLLEKEVGEVWVTGEVTNLRVQSSGHMYFTLKDAESQLSCVLFRNEAKGTRELVQDGRKLLLQGNLTVYEPRGQYQLRVTTVELQGVGALQAAFEKLKQKLSAEGLFAAERKRELPRYPQRIGLVTSPTGAAIRDVLHVVRRRNPGMEILLAPCRVQGEGAAAEIADAIRLLNQFNAKAGDARAKLDLILITRGGGSLEDLWAFNEEVVARAIFDSALPVVSAVGHEIDFTISDLVADLRAATPSAAAEIITEGVFSSIEFLGDAVRRIHQLCKQQVEGKEHDYEQVLARLNRAHPRLRLNEWLQRLDDLQGSLWRCAKQGVRQHKLAWRNASDRLARLRPGQILRQRREAFERLEARMGELASRRCEDLRGRLKLVEGRLRLLGPEQVLARGYSITMDARTGRLVRSSADVCEGQLLKTKLKKGEVQSKVQKK